jgi:hypothetical protein
MHKSDDELGKWGRRDSQDNIPITQTAFGLGHRIGNIVRVKKDTGTRDGELGVEMALESTCGGVRSTNWISIDATTVVVVVVVVVVGSSSSSSSRGCIRYGRW